MPSSRTETETVGTGGARTGLRRDPGTLLGLASLGIYLIGGIATFLGVGLVMFVEGDLWGWGEALGIGYLLVCIGLCLSVGGVLLMRLVRCRT